MLLLTSSMRVKPIATQRRPRKTDNIGNRQNFAKRCVPKIQVAPLAHNAGWWTLTDAASKEGVWIKHSSEPVFPHHVICFVNKMNPWSQDPGGVCGSSYSMLGRSVKGGVGTEFKRMAVMKVCQSDVALGGTRNHSQMSWDYKTAASKWVLRSSSFMQFQLSIGESGTYSCQIPTCFGNFAPFGVQTFYSL